MQILIHGLSCSRSRSAVPPVRAGPSSPLLRLDQLSSILTCTVASS
jgi:hypothetical protein